MIRNVPVCVDGYLDGQEILPRLPVVFPFRESQVPDLYPRQHTRRLRYDVDSYLPRIATSTSWTNLWTYSEADAGWTKANMTSGSGVANPLDGALTALPYYESSATDVHNRNRSYTFASEAWHCMSAFAQYLGRDWIRLRANDGTQDHTGWFNLSTGQTSVYRPILTPSVLNGGFETAGPGAVVFLNWTDSVAGGSTIARDTSVFNPNGTGAASALFTISGGAGPASLTTATAPLTIGQRYRLTFWAKAATGTPTIDWAPPSSTSYLTQVLTASWVQYSVDFVATSASLKLVSSTASTVFNVDDCTLTPIGQPPLISAVLRNGGFETAGGGGADVFANWTEGAGGTSSINRDTVVFFSGAASCRMDVDAGGGNTTIVSGNVMQASRRYQLTMRAKADASCSCYSTTGTGGAGTGVQQFFSLTTSWQLFTCEFTATGPQLIIDRASANGRSIWIDDITLTPLDEPVLTAWQRPGTSLWRCGMAFYPRAAAGTAAIDVSSDGSTLSYAGDTAKGMINWGAQLVLGAVPGPYIATTSAARTISAPDYDDADAFAWLAGESPLAESLGGLGIVTRTFASIPGQQVRRDWQSFARPSMHNCKSGSTYGVSFDGGVSSSLFTSRTSVTLAGVTGGFNVAWTSHGKSVGDLYAVWADNGLWAFGRVAYVPDANHFYGATEDLVAGGVGTPLPSPAYAAFASGASVRYVNGARDVLVRIARDYFLPGVSLLADGSTMADLDSIPAVTVYTSGQAWLDRIVASATFVPVSASELDTYQGPIVCRDTVSVRLADALETQALV